ncbi:nuclear transport factor 2 family protein [Lysobacter sp. Root983]|uniref:YybH family protein n=1 Tax=Lysobacter sp. Root983 TaxID=1736613 RepID=UPI001F2F29C2|nr:nuclear transport factor 2 family protein [Lysobacter sp. Root983]
MRMNPEPTPFHQVLSAYQAAVRAKDVEAFLTMYADDLQVFDMWGGWSLRGLEAWREMATEWFGALGSDYVVVGFDEVEASVDGALAVGHALLSYTAYSADGQRLRSLDNRITVAMRWTGETWKVFHEHTSAPIDHETTKAVLRRDGGG